MKRTSAERRLFRHILARAVGISRDSGLGKVLVGQPTGGLRADLRHREEHQTGRPGGLAHHAQRFIQPLLSRRARLREAKPHFGLHKGCDVQQLRGSAVCSIHPQCPLHPFRDATPEQVPDLHYRILGYEGQPHLEQLPAAGLSADYVARETKRALASVRDRVQIYPGIDIDIPTGKDEKKTQPSDVRAAVKAAFTAGAPGVILSRKYSEVKLPNLSGAGEALRELRIR